MAGTPPNFEPTEREHVALDEIVESLFPVAPRRPGTIYDTYIRNPDIGRYPLQEVTVPTLIVAAVDDTLAPYQDTRAMAQRNAGTELVAVPRGGHALTKLDPHATAAVERFLRTPASHSTSPPEEVVSRG